MKEVMSFNPFSTAENTQLKARVCLGGVSGSGKTWLSLVLASSLGDKIAVIDTENDSASRYLGKEIPGTAKKMTFDRMNMVAPYSPEKYIEGIQAAVAHGYDVVIIDSATHEWTGDGGILSSVDKAATSSLGWKECTPRHNRFLEAIIRCPIHLIATVRFKDQYVVEQDDRGKYVPKKVGVGAIQRDQFEYEFDIAGNIELKDHAVTFEKSRCSELDGKRFLRPGAEIGEAILSWLTKGHGLTVSEADLTRLKIIAREHKIDLGKLKDDVIKKYKIKEMQELNINQLREVILEILRANKED